MYAFPLRCAMLVLAPAVVVAQAVPTDSLVARLRRAEAAIQALQKENAAQTAGPVQTRSRIGVEISGQLWAQPVPLELLVRTEIDLETGQVEVADLAPTRVS